ncbi:MAG: OmpH family outer membrane protein [Vicinamibacteria bacterium]|nr:OmpH family outer membrane protein [Vicinamibacteria bacterium]
MTKSLTLLLLVAAPAVLAQEPAAAGLPAKAPKIAVIDMTRVSNESLLGKSYAQKLENLQNEIGAEATKKQNELTKLDTSIKTLREELEKQANVLSPEGAEKKQQEIVKKTRDRQAFVEDSQAELGRMRERAQQQAQQYNNEFQLKVRPIVEAVAKEKGVDILIDSQAALAVTKDYDISRDVIVKADDAERAAKPKPAAAPAASPAASPAGK